MADGHAYAREGLADAVHASTTLSEAITRLGRAPTAARRRHVRMPAERWGIDVSHLEREGVRHTERRLRKLVRESSSIAEVVRRLGISPVGGNQAHISRRVAALGIDTSHFTATHPRCPKGALDDRLVLGSPVDGRVPGERLRRALVRRGVPEECAECAIGPEWNGRPLRLEVDHLNGDWSDNRPQNLRLLCPNCHAVTDTFRGRKRRTAKR